MRTPWNQLVLTAIFAAALSPTLAQTATPQSANPGAALLARANSGDPAAQLQTGDIFAAGNGQARSARQLTEDYRQAAVWYRKAADQGSVAGEIRLAALYRDGRGVARDMEQAAALYRRAAERGDADAQATLGVLYSMGQGVPKSDVEAYYWLDLAAAAKGPNQQKYAANRQMIGAHITAGELEAVEDRVAEWLAAHPRANGAE
ncbi:MAG: tetratricopeptide repeat protein [Terracidiphilus sp.]|jgi:TPR repeat protein